MTAKFDINEVAVQGIGQALRNAAERWEDAGAPGTTDQSRESIREFVKREKPDPSQARETYRMLVYWTENEQMARDRTARSEAMDRARDQRQIQKEAMTSEIKAIRERLGMRPEEMDTRFQVKPNTCKNAENPGGSYSNDFVASILGRYRVEAKLAGVGSAVETES